MRRLRVEDLNDCFAHDKDRLTHDEALELIAAQASAMVGSERIPLIDAAGRYAAEPVSATRQIPPCDNAAVDGYAFAHRDLAAEGDSRLQLVERIAAGDGRTVALEPGPTARIFTGAAMPDGADTVVMQEDTSIDDDGSIVIPHGLKAGANRRRAGEDLDKGATVVDPGQRLRPQDIAALASIGTDHVSVFEELKVGVLSSGDEIAAVGMETGRGQIFDANGPLLASMLQGLPVKIVPLGIVPDREDAVRSRLNDASQKCDVIISSGGASRGEEDHLVRTVAGSGQLFGWQIAVKPGRPLGFGTYGDAAVMLLPGNPVAVMVCFLLYIVPWLAALGGGRFNTPMRIPVRAGFEIPRKKPDRREFLRGWLLERDGALVAEKYPRDGSGLISSLRAASGLIEIAEPVRGVSDGDTVAFIPFSEFGLSRL